MSSLGKWEGLGTLGLRFQRVGTLGQDVCPGATSPPSLPGVEHFSLDLRSVSWSCSLRAQCLLHAGSCPVCGGYVGQRLLVPTPSRSSVCTLGCKGPCFPPAGFQDLSGGSKPCQNPGYLLAKAALSWESVIPAGDSVPSVWLQSLSPPPPLPTDGREAVLLIQCHVLS